MTRAFLAVSLSLFGASLISETIEPPALKVRQICGQAFVANARIEIRRDPHGNVIAATTTDREGNFAFGKVAGRVYIAMPGNAIQDWYPLDVTPAPSTCRHPLYIRPTIGSESAITVSFRSE
jgi:hypothetical protein